MKSLIILILAIYAIFFSINYLGEIKESPKSTQEATQVENKYESLPPLLKRNAELAALPEWDKLWEQGQNLHQKVKSTGDAKAGLQLAALYMQEARITGDHPYYYNAALDVLEVVIEQKPEDALYYNALTSKASVLLSQHQFKEALTLGLQASKLDYSDAQVYGILCDAYVELGHLDKAVEMADKMVAMKPDMRSYARISYLRELHGDVDGAIQAMEMAIKAGLPGQEGRAWARTTLANLQLAYGQTEVAERQLNQCLAERKDYAFAVAALAKIAFEKNAYGQAKQSLEKAIALVPEFSFYVQRAHIEQEEKAQKKLDQTVAELKQMFKEDSESGHNMNIEEAVFLMDVLDQPKKALALLEKEYHIRPENLELNKWMGKAYYKLGEIEPAMKHINVASRSNWRDTELLCLKGLALYKLGEKEQGITWIEQAGIGEKVNQTSIFKEAMSIVKEI